MRRFLNLNREIAGKTSLDEGLHHVVANLASD